MKQKRLKLIVTMILVLAGSCNEPKSVVTNIIHPDGSITRKIEIRNSENNLSLSNVQIPYDSTWIIRDSIEIKNGDTTWVRRAEKLFSSAEEINSDYKNDSSYNRGVTRRTAFSRKFRWFHTDFRFAEIIERKFTYGYPVSDFLNHEELTWFYSPETVKGKEISGPDSLKFKALSDSVDKKTDKWLINSLMSGWIDEFARLYNEKGGKGVNIDSLKAREGELVKIVYEIDNTGGNFDSLWNQGYVINRFIGEANAVKYREEADSALNRVMSDLFVDFRNYNVKMVMPGRLTASNGFIDSSQVLMWPVASDFFLTGSYEMWAESKVPNRWAWIVSGLFILFVFTAIALTKKEKG